jgi:cellulose synthase/poly-beta-1,6-N-acetylglucosamine synthase-like glycosyltransferase
VASGAGAAKAGHPFMCNGANLAYRKSAFIRVNGFKGNEGFISGDDVFLLHKMKKEFGRKSVIFNDDKKSIVKTYPAPGLKKFLSQRIRWASKSKGYKDGLSILTAIVIFSYSLTVLLSFIAGFFNPIFFLAFGGLLLIKMILDSPLMLGITRFTGQRRLMKWYLPFQVFYPVYILIAGVPGLFGRKRW